MVLEDRDWSSVYWEIYNSAGWVDDGSDGSSNSGSQGTYGPSGESEKPRDRTSDVDIGG